MVSALTLATSVHGTSDSRPLAHGLRDAIYALAAVTGLIGTGFHFYNVGRKDRWVQWQNLFYGAPLGAPFAILLSGLIGFCSERVREHLALENADDIQSPCRTHDGGSDKRRTTRNDGRSRRCCISAAPSTIR